MSSTSPDLRPGVQTQFDPDHKSYIRHIESSEYARRDIAPIISSHNNIYSLSQLSSSLSASSSLSGSTHHPRHGSEDFTPAVSASSHDDRLESLMESSSLDRFSNNDFSNLPTSDAAASAFSSHSSSLDDETSNHKAHQKYKHKNHKTFKHYRRPKVTESPRLVYLCEKFIRDRNVAGLALIARRRGLPPKLRQYAWPLLLASHSYVLNPNPEGDVCAQPLTRDMQVPAKKIEKEISRFQQKRQRLHHSSTSATSTSNSGTDMSSEQDKYRKEVTDWLEEKRQKAILEALVSFLGKWGHIVQYERIMVDMAFSLADYVDPVCRLEDLANLFDDGSTFNDSFSPDFSSVQSEDFMQSSTTRTTSEAATPTPTTSASPSHTPFSLQSLSFALPYNFTDVFEHLMLVVLHAPSDKRKFGNSAGVATNRISYFLAAFRQLFPDLSSHFDEEDVCVTSSTMDSGDVWLVWWINWLGVRAWSRHDRARIWDMYFGWRPSSGLPDLELSVAAGHVQSSSSSSSPPPLQSESIPTMPYSPSDIKVTDDMLSLDLDDLERELGPDPFWSQNIVEDKSIRTPSSPLIDHIFMCLALLKSRCHVLLELDQSEIRSALGRFDQCQDIENVITEAGEIWRSWRHQEDVENQE